MYCTVNNKFLGVVFTFFTEPSQSVWPHRNCP